MNKLNAKIGFFKDEIKEKFKGEIKESSKGNL